MNGNEDEDEIAKLRAAIERAETQEREFMAAEAELEHAGRRISDQLERLGGRDPVSERKLAELRRTRDINTGDSRRLREHLRDLRRELAAVETGAGEAGER